jgi:CHAT domain-containing protein/Tfp pilus assembly protein PilF
VHYTHYTYRARRLLLALLSLTLLTCWPAQAQELKWKQLSEQVEALRAQGKYAQGLPIASQAVEAARSTFGDEHPNYATSINALAVLYLAQHQYSPAVPLFQQALAIREKVLGPEHLDVAEIVRNIGECYLLQGRYAQTEPLYKQALSIRERALGLEHPLVAASLNDLGWLYSNMGQIGRAEALNIRALAIREKVLATDHPDIAESLDDLATLYRKQGKYLEAEPLLKRALEIREKVWGPDHPGVGAILNNLALLYRNDKRYDIAEKLYLRSLAISKKEPGPESPTYARGLNNLAAIYMQLNQFTKAEPLFKEALAIREKNLGLEHVDIGQTLVNFGSFYRLQGDFSQSVSMLERALAIYEKGFGPEHLEVANALNNLAISYQKQSRNREAEALLTRALNIREKAFGPGHHDVAQSLTFLSTLERDQGNDAQALTLSRRASAITRQRIVAAGVDDAASREASTGKDGLFQHLTLLALNPANELAPSVTDEALQIVQLAQSSGTASAIAKMAARFASGDDALAVLARRKQDAAERRSKGEAQLIKAASQLPAKRDAASEQRQRETLARTVTEIESIDADLTQRFPAYQELARPEPVTVAKVQRLLHPGEAMLVYGLDASGSYVWVVTPKNASFRALPVKRKDLEAQVAKVRSQMALDGADQGLKVSVDVLQGLYTSLFAPIAPELEGVTHVMVVPAGPLQSLPFGMLVTAPTPEIKTDADYRKVPWLIKKYAFSVLPSVSSIQAFRQFAKTQQAKGAFVGFGDPVLGTESDLTRGARAKLDVAAVFRNVGAGAGVPGVQGAEIADVDFIRSRASLPETADELRSMAKILKADPSSVWLQEQATETRVKTMDLSRYRTLAFATHGTLAGQISGAGEPGLLLTPPKVGTVEDDGYLAASEIARLNLNADWVVLSACNTAAADGTPGAEGLSGMAKAFFYAGARSLLVSHWPVATEATVPLTTVMLKEYEAHPQRGKAQAQRKAMLALMNTPGRPEYAHPLYWAPFVVVGEGGAGGGGK